MGVQAISPFPGGWQGSVKEMASNGMHVDAKLNERRRSEIAKKGAGLGTKG